ncbi:hypothetical protein, partial [Enterococcus faecium]|uniref:hypothetical protein n=1 Tax=Enterococcus faecium TaxID=1352 RepID=UPI0034E95765
LGHISFSSELNVCNMTCQDSYGEGTRHLHYGYLIDCLQELSFFIKHTHKEIKRVVLPYKMGADRAGGDWETVIEIVQHVFKNIVDEVVVVKFKQ